jgi:hypothetical protein
MSSGWTMVIGCEAKTNHGGRKVLQWYIRVKMLKSSNGLKSSAGVNRSLR